MLIFSSCANVLGLHEMCMRGNRESESYQTSKRKCHNLKQLQDTGSVRSLQLKQEHQMEDPEAC